jgi:hypothetical protein
MTRDEWLVVLATEPATAAQRGAVMGEFQRLGLAGPGDRPERLAVCAALLGIDRLGSTRELVMGQAGQLVHALRHVPARADLAAVVAARKRAADQAAARAAPVSAAAMLRAVAAAMAGCPGQVSAAALGAG